MLGKQKIDNMSRRQQRQVINRLKRLDEKGDLTAKQALRLTKAQTAWQASRPVPPPPPPPVVIPPADPIPPADDGTVTPQPLAPGWYSGSYWDGSTWNTPTTTTGGGIAPGTTWGGGGGGSSWGEFDSTAGGEYADVGSSGAFAPSLQPGGAMDQGTLAAGAAAPGSEGGGGSKWLLIGGAVLGFLLLKKRRK